MIPCNKCVCIAICRHKRFHILVTDCSLVHDYLLERDNETHHYDLMIILDPTTWRVQDSKDTSIEILPF